jgi:hypothetical protein
MKASVFAALLGALALTAHAADVLTVLFMLYPSRI